MRPYDRKINKIKKKINKIAVKGYTHQQEFFNYIDEVISNGNYNVFKDVLEIDYKYKIDKGAVINDIKKEIWYAVLRGTKPLFLQKLTKLYKENNVYQQSYIIYEYDNQKDYIIGQIVEEEYYDKGVEYYLQNKEYARIKGNLRKFLRVTRINNQNVNETILIDDIDENISEDENLFNRYKKAIQYLKNN